MRVDKIRLVIADDHKIFRDGLKLLFKKEGNVELVGEVSNGKELVEIVKTLRPDIVMTDILMPVMDGIVAVKQILSQYPETGIIALSMVDEEDLIVEVLEAGALGYLLKNAEKEEILDAIDSVKNGNPYYSNSISSSLLKSLAVSRHNPYKEKQPVSFSKKELDIIQLICKEKTSKEIGELLFYSSRTVEWYRAKILEKMQVKTPAGVVLYAVKNKLIKI